MAVAPVPRLRIVHVTDCYLPRVGGIELQVAELAAAQAVAGHDPYVVTVTAGQAGPRVHRLLAPMTLRALRYEIPLRTGRNLAELLARLRPDVVHVHAGVVAPLAWAGARCAARQGSPLVASVHSTWGPGARLLYRGLAAAYGWTDWPVRLLPVSDTVARQVRRAVGIEMPVTVVPNGIATRSWPARRPVEWGGPLRVVAVGRLAPRKRMPALLRALRAASARLGNGALTVRIAGAGPVGPWVRSYLTWHGMTGWVSLLGELPRREVPGLLADSDVFVTMAVHEAFGLAALEARTVGVPILARRDSGIAQLVEHGRNGLLASDDQGVVNALVHLAEDPQLLRGLRAADPAQAYDWSVVLGRVDACYAAATATLSPRPA